jgi:hypothetical protein
MLVVCALVWVVFGTACPVRRQAALAKPVPAA